MIISVMEQFKGAQKWLNPTNVILVIAFYLAGTSITEKFDKLDECYKHYTRDKMLDSLRSVNLTNKLERLDAENAAQNQFMNQISSNVSLLFQYSNVPQHERPGKYRSPEPYW